MSNTLAFRKRRFQDSLHTFSESDIGDPDSISNRSSSLLAKLQPADRVRIA